MSTSRRCDIWLATDKKWYMVLGNFEYAYDDADCTVYGPFDSRDDLEKELDRHSNPGCLTVNEWGTIPPPVVRETKSVIKRKRAQRRIK